MQFGGEGGDPPCWCDAVREPGAPVLYVHGATFPSALSVGYRFGGRSWLDDLAAHGYDAWAFDFAGFGGSDRMPGWTDCGKARRSGRRRKQQQIARVVDKIVEATGCGRVSIMAHSWALFRPGFMRRNVPKGSKHLPIGPHRKRRFECLPAPESVGAWRLVSVAEQSDTFCRGRPAGHPPVLIDEELRYWGPAYLATDALIGFARSAVRKIPAGPQADILAAWNSALAYKPEENRCANAYLRGEWDSVSNDRDADWLLSRICADSQRRQDREGDASDAPRT